MIWDCGRGLGMYHDGGLYPRVPEKKAELKFSSGGSFEAASNIVVSSFIPCADTLL